MSPRRALHVYAYGRPTVQGSKKLGEHGQMLEQAGAHLAKWRHDIVRQTRQRFIELGLSSAAQMPYFGERVPLQVTLQFDINLSAYRATDVTDPPDLDKLTRAVLDALTMARAWADDGQVVRLFVTKLVVGEHNPTGAFIMVEPWRGKLTPEWLARRRVRVLGRRFAEVTT